MFRQHTLMSTSLVLPNKKMRRMKVGQCSQPAFISDRKVYKIRICPELMMREEKFYQPMMREEQFNKLYFIRCSKHSSTREMLSSPGQFSSFNDEAYSSPQSVNPELQKRMF